MQLMRPSRARPSWLAPILGATLVLNLVDLVATIFFVTAGYAEEANPVMASLLSLGAAPFAVAKLAMVSVGIYVLWRFGRHALARVGAGVVTAAYAALCVYHLGWMHVVVA